MKKTMEKNDRRGGTASGHPTRLTAQGIRRRTQFPSLSTILRVFVCLSAAVIRQGYGQKCKIEVDRNTCIATVTMDVKFSWSFESIWIIKEHDSLYVQYGYSNSGVGILTTQTQQLSSEGHCEVEDALYPAQYLNRHPLTQNAFTFSVGVGVPIAKSFATPSSKTVSASASKSFATPSSETVSASASTTATASASVVPLLRLNPYPSAISFVECKATVDLRNTVSSFHAKKVEVDQDGEYVWITLSGKPIDYRVRHTTSGMTTIADYGSISVELQLSSRRNLDRLEINLKQNDERKDRLPPFVGHQVVLIKKIPKTCKSARYSWG